MKPFQYVSASSIKGAQQLAADHGRYLSGGIDLLGEMKEYITSPKLVVDIKRVRELGGIHSGQKTWTIGSNVTIAEIEDHPGIKSTFPGLQQAASEVASPQIRNVSTLGGNLAQHSRCWYYRHRHVECLKKGGAICHARQDENKYHSLFSGNSCISPVVSNMSIALGALNATVVVARKDQMLRLSIPELYERAWENPMAHNSLNPDDLILKVEIPVQANRSAYQQISEKTHFDWALVSCAAAAQVQNGTLAHPRVFLGVVAPVPYQSEAANKFLEGKTLDDKVAAEAADILLKDAEPQEHNGYKIPMAHTLIRRTLLQLKA